MDALTPADRFEILDLISTYSWAYDTRDWELHRTLWTDDAVLEVGAPPRTGAEITPGSQQRREAMAAEGIQTRHYQTNTLFERVDADRVQARTIFTVLRQHQGQPAPSPARTGEYHDEFVRTPSGWKFSRRRAVFDQD